MPSFVETVPPVPEKIFEGFLPYMDMAAPSPSYRCFLANLALIGQAVSEEKLFEYCDDLHVYCPGVVKPAAGVQFFSEL